MKKLKRFAAVFLAFVIAAAVYLYWGNNSITVTEYAVSSAKLPKSFDGYRIVQVSDLHNKDFGKKLTDKIVAAKPDIIVITGDIIDSYHTKIAVSAEFAEAVSKIAPVYYVTGNHENRIAEYSALRTQMEGMGITVLDGKTVNLEKNGGTITLSGIDDLTFFNSSMLSENRFEFKANLRSIAAETGENTSILLSHRPELLDIYAETGFDVVFSGHAHGGQIRLPFVGGLFCPDQGFFPEYTEGIHTKDGTNMIVSRGLGNSIFPLRVFNRPELVVCELRMEK